MSKKEHGFHKITRPGQYVAFIVLEASTLEGPGYVFMACDGYSEFAFHIGTERDDSPETILKNIYLFMEDKDFLRHSHKGFTLVFEHFEELAERIEAIIKPSNGKTLFNKGFHQRIAAPLIASLNQRFSSIS